MNFVICQHSRQVAQVKVPLGSTVANLITEAKTALKLQGYESSQIICLESVMNEEVVDYSLLMEDFIVDNYEDYSQFNIVYRQAVSSQNAISLNDFQFKKCLGQGASATVFLVRHKGNGRLYALKQIHQAYFTEFKRLEQVLRERRIMIQITNNFPFIAKLYASFESDMHLNFLLEFYPGGEMFYHLSSKRLTEDEAKLYFAEMVLTLEFLHENQIIYRDLKPENIMIDFNGHSKLTDFGLCKINLSKEDLATSYCGSVEYMAPEVRQSQGYSYSADFYTLGAFLFEMIVGVPPYYNTQSLNFRDSGSPGFRSLVESLIAKSVQDRISDFKTIKSNAWMSNVVWNQVYKSEIQMPYEINVYKTYIHEEFKSIDIEYMDDRHVDEYERLFSFFTFIKSGSDNESFAREYPSIKQTSGREQDLQEGGTSATILQSQPRELSTQKGTKSFKTKHRFLKGSKDSFSEAESTPNLEQQQ